MAATPSSVPIPFKVHSVTLEPGCDSFPALVSGHVTITILHQKESDAYVVMVLTYQLNGATPNTTLDVGFYQLIPKDGESTAPMLINATEFNPYPDLPQILPPNPLGPFTRQGRTVGPYNGFRIGTLTTDANGVGVCTITNLHILPGQWDVQFWLTPAKSNCPCYQSSGKFGSTTLISTAFLEVPNVLDLPYITTGMITRLYPHGTLLYFHVSGDRQPYGFTKSDYNVIDTQKPGSSMMVDLLMRAAEHRWTVTVRRGGSDGRVTALHGYPLVEYVYVDFKD